MAFERISRRLRTRLENATSSSIIMSSKNQRKMTGNAISKRSPETIVDSSEGKMPQKRLYRSRAHCNPLAQNDGFAYPISSAVMNWSLHFPMIQKPAVNFIDIGCGFGGLTVGLSTLYPDKLVLGMEIRAKSIFPRIDALRRDSAIEGQYQNAACLRTNCMRYLPNFFNKSQIEKIFICFPDPHFKVKNHRRRIVSPTLLSEYAHFLCPGGKLYLITDVEELHHWHVKHCNEHPMFRRIPDGEASRDPAVSLMLEQTEEGIKVARIGGRKHFAVYERISDEEANQPSKLSILSLF
eukprot:gene4513-8966_t